MTSKIWSYARVVFKNYELSRLRLLKFHPIKILWAPLQKQVTVEGSSTSTYLKITLTI